MQLLAYSLVQPAVVLHDLDEGVDRMHELFRTVPSERNLSREFNNAVYAFANTTYLELLDGAHEGHTRMRFLERQGPGLYMLCVDVANDDPGEVERELESNQVRVVAPGRPTENIVAGWHLHPRDAGDILTLLALKKDRRDNTDWAGHKAQAYVPGNTRIVEQLAGVIAWTAEPAAEASAFGRVGFPMTPTGDAMVWRGPTGTLLELWPQTNGTPGRREYALCFTARDFDRAATHLEACGLAWEGTQPGGRRVSSVDPVLGVRIVLQPADV